MTSVVPQDLVSAAAPYQQTSSDEGKNLHRHTDCYSRPKQRAVVRHLSKEVMQHVDEVQHQQ